MGKIPPYRRHRLSEASKIASAIFVIRRIHVVVVVELRPLHVDALSAEIDSKIAART